MKPLDFSNVVICSGFKTVNRDFIKTLLTNLPALYVSRKLHWQETFLLWVLGDFPNVGKQKHGKKSHRFGHILMVLFFRCEKGSFSRSSKMFSKVYLTGFHFTVSTGSSKKEKPKLGYIMKHVRN